MNSSIWFRALLVTGLWFGSIPAQASSIRHLITCEGFSIRSKIDRIEIDYQLGEALLYATTGGLVAVPIQRDELLGDEPPVRESYFEGKVAGAGLTSVLYRERLSKGSATVTLAMGTVAEIKAKAKTCKKTVEPIGDLELPRKSGSSCGLLDDADALDGRVVKDRSFTTGEEKKMRSALNKMSKTEREQVLTTARWLKDEIGSSKRISTLEEAASFLLEEGGQVDLGSTLRIKGRVYKMVRAYPGDTASGLLFESSGTRPLAEISDSDVYCRGST